MIKNIKLIVKFSFNSHKNGKINNDAMVPGKNGKYPIPNPEQKKFKIFLLEFIFRYCH